MCWLFAHEVSCILIRWFLSYIFFKNAFISTLKKLRRKLDGLWRPFRLNWQLYVFSAHTPMCWLYTQEVSCILVQRFERYKALIKHHLRRFIHRLRQSWSKYICQTYFSTSYRRIAKFILNKPLNESTWNFFGILPTHMGMCRKKIVMITQPEPA